jgi:hypothetical protein
MSDKGLATVLSCTNTEPKNILLSLCLDAQHRTQIELTHNFLALADTPLINRHLVRDYLAQSFAPAGVVDSILLPNYRNQVALHYALTQDGLATGVIAAFTMKWAVDNNISSYALLGQGNTSHTRFRLLEDLEDGMGTAELERKAGLSSLGARKHMRSLARSGIVVYDRNDDRKFGEEVATISFAPGTRAAVSEYTQALRQFMTEGTGPVIAAWKVFENDAAKESYAQRAAAIYASTGPHLNPTGADEWKTRIVDAIKTEGQKRHKELVEEIDLPEGRGWQYLRELTDDGILKRRRANTATFYALN